MKVPIWCLNDEGEQILAYINEEGKEVGDPTPMAPPVGMLRPLSNSELIRQMVRRELSERAAEVGMESFEEADDFYVEDDPLDPHTPYEAVFDPLTPEQEAAMKPPRSDSGSVKEKDDGGTSVDEGRVESGDGRARGRNQVGKGRSKPKQDADDAGSVREADSGTAGSDE